MTLPPKLRELIEEFKSVVGSRRRALDGLLPTLVFAPINAWLGLVWAATAALGVALALLVWRLRAGRSVLYALLGLGGVVIAIAIALISREAAGFFLPAIVSSSVTVLLCIVSALLGRPLVAWTSHLARGWPLEWYWHPRIRPAYTEVTLAWAVYFFVRAALQILGFLQGDAIWLTLLTILGGWPATILLLAASYLYGTRRLEQLGGPSVEEFRQGDPGPWQGQKRGF